MIHHRIDFHPEMHWSVGVNCDKSHVLFQLGGPSGEKEYDQIRVVLTAKEVESILSELKKAQRKLGSGEAGKK